MSGRLVLLRHGQSYGNVERRLDTLPPGTALTPLGRDQARAFARSGCPGRHCSHTRWLSGPTRRPRWSLPNSTWWPTRLPAFTRYR